MPKTMTPPATAASAADPSSARGEPRMHKTRIDLPQEQRVKLVQLLNARLADSIDLSLQSKQAHWNVKGPRFKELHELFDEIHGRAQGYIDEIAERITALGGTAYGTAQVVARDSTLPAYPTDIFEGLAHVNAMADRLATFAKAIRQGIDEAGDLGDQGTADLFTAIVREVDKDLWFVEAHVQVSQ